MPSRHSYDPMFPFIAIPLLVMSMIDSPLHARPLKLAIIGLTHTHVHWLLGRPDRGDIEIVGIVEANEDLASRYLEQYGLPNEIVYSTVQQLVDRQELDAVAAFGSTFEHLSVVEFFAPRGVHVMVEKPLAVNMQHANQMAKLARKHNIHLLTNYETSWYASNVRAFEMLHVTKQIGNLRKVVAHAGHRGPKEIGVNSEFLDWLTDPVKNGGGAVTDFGCYGVNLVNLLNRNKRPQTVTAVLRTFKPTVYPNVDDDATIMLGYQDMNAVIQASWNWPISRKDLELYGTTGQIVCLDRNRVQYRLGDQKTLTSIQLDDRKPPFDDPFSYLSAVVDGQIKPKPHELSSLENNLLVVEILDAAKRSAKLQRTVKLDAK